MIKSVKRHFIRHWKECASDEVVKIDLTGDINLADDWHTMKVLNEQENGIYDCISKEIMEELQSADISVINNQMINLYFG